METLDGNYSNIREKVTRMEKDLKLNLDKFMKDVTLDRESVEKYYKMTDMAYKKYHSKYGFMHFHVSKDGKFSPEGAFYQPDTVSRFIKPGDKVLELGFGKGANIYYLAGKHPDAEFTGLDLKTPHAKNTFSNVTLYEQDYRDLSRFADNTFDVIYGIETLVCCPDKDPAFREFNRVLKPGGHFIVYDYATPEAFESYDPVVQKGVALATLAGAGSLTESFAAWQDHFTSNNFKEESVTDLTKELLPDPKRLEKLAKKVMGSKTRAHMSFGMMPDLFTGNIIVGYVAYDSFNEGFIEYKEWIYTK